MWWYSLKIKVFAPKSLIPSERKNTGGVKTEIVSFSLIKVNHLRIPRYYFVYFWGAHRRTAVQMPRSQVKIPSSPPSSLSSYKLGHRPGPQLGIWTMQKISQVLQKDLLHKNDLIFTWERTASDHYQCQSSQLFHHEREAQRVWVRSLLLCDSNFRQTKIYQFNGSARSHGYKLVHIQNLDFDLHVDRQGNNRRDHRASHPERSLSHLTSKTFSTPSEQRTWTEFNLEMLYHVLCSSYLAYPDGLTIPSPHRTLQT